MITRLDQVTEYPLCWPQSKSRAAQRKKSAFMGTTVPRSIKEIEDEMGKWGIRHFAISQEPMHRNRVGDPGVAVWWMPKGKTDSADLRVLACDTFHYREDNLHAIALTLENLRAIERYGTYTTDQAAEGMKALPPPPAGPAPPNWWEILGCTRDWPLDAVEMAYRSKASKAHPDAGGSAEEMATVNAAIEVARKEKT